MCWLVYISIGGSKVEAATFSKMMVLVYQYSLRGISDDGNLHQNHSKNLKSDQYKLIFIIVFLTELIQGCMNRR